MNTKSESAAGLAHESACTIKELCARMRISPPTVYAEIKAGRLRATKIGRATRIFERDVQSWLAGLPNTTN